MANSKGIFDVPIGTGSKYFPTAPTKTLISVFDNTQTFDCASASNTPSGTYTPASGDIRRLRVQFHDGTGWNLISPDNEIRTVPFAAYSSSSERLGNYLADDFLLKAGLPSCGANTFLSWNGSALTCQSVSGANGGTVTNVSSANGDITVATGTNTPVLTLNSGTGANQIVKLDGSGKLPALDGSQLTNLPGGTISALTGDVSASGSGSVAATVNSVGGSMAANIHNAELLANTATNNNTANAIVRRDASGNFTAGVITANLTGNVTGSVTGSASLNILKSGDTMTGDLTFGSGKASIYTDSGANTVTLKAPTTIGTSYVLKFPTTVAISNGQVLTSDTSGNLSWTTPSTTATSYSGVLPIANGGTNSSTALSNNRIMVSNGGAIVESAALTNGQILIGSTGAAPAAATLTAGSGVTITNSAGGITIAASGSGGTVTNVTGSAPINVATGTSTPVVSLADGSAAGQVFRWNGTNTWSATKLNYMDLINNVAASPWPASSCGAGEAVTWSSASDSFVCTAIVASVSGNSTLTDGKIWVGDSANKAQPVTMSGDATLSNAGALALTNSGATAGTYRSVTVDAKGRVTAGANPTTLAGYGITDAVKNGGNTGTITSGLDAGKPGSPASGDLFVATDSQKIYRYNGSSWDLMSSASGSGGTITALTGDVSASGSGSIAATVNAIGGSSAANVHNAELLANAATSANTASTIVKRDASGNFTAGTITANLTGAASLNVLKSGDTMTGDLTFGSGKGTIYTDSGSNTVTLKAPTAVGTNYVLRLPTNVAASNGQVLTSDTSGNLTWTTPSTTATSYSGVLPVANGGTNSSTALNNNRIMVSSGGAIVESAALTNGQILIGSTGAAPTAAALTAGSGVTITNSAGGITIAASGSGGTVTSVTSANTDIAVANTGTTPVLTLSLIHI